MAEDFPATESGVSLGRITLADGSVDFVPLSTPTPGDANAGPKIGPLVINEVMYRPASFADEFIEIYNMSSEAMSLDGWRQDAPTVLATLPQGVSIPAGGYAVVVSTSPESFRTTYGVPAGVPVIAPLAGSLSDQAQTVRLIFGGVLIVDEVSYHSLAPWPTAAAMGGRSLERIAPPEYGNDPAHWKASMAIGGTPGASNTTLTLRPDGDFNGDFTVDTRDIDLICTHLSNPAYTAGHYSTGGTVMFDLTSDGHFTAADVTHLITNVLHTTFGDVDLDRVVGLADLLALRRNYGRTTGMGWSQGDITGDGRVDRSDLALLTRNFSHRTVVPPSPAASAVDEALSNEPATTTELRLTARVRQAAGAAEQSVPPEATPLGATATRGGTNTSVLRANRARRAPLD
jgi:hypothetical protein